MTTALNPNQQVILEHAVQDSGGKIAWFPEHIKGGARAKVLEGLFKRALITPDGDDWLVAAESYDALGLPRPGALPPTITLDDPELEAEVEATYWESLDQMLTRVDIVSVNCPHTPATYHLLSARRLKLLKPSAYIVNTARGGVIDQEALIAASAVSICGASAALAICSQ